MSDSNIADSEMSFDKKDTVKTNNEEFEAKKKNEKEKPFELANGNFHFLPVKIDYTGYSKVNTFFDTLIEDKTIGDNYNYTASFRGRLFNGKKVNNQNKFKIHHTVLSKIDKNKFVVKKLDGIENFYVWKFDDKFNNNERNMNFEKILNNLNILK
jgi:hypothetical protein